MKDLHDYRREYGKSQLSEQDVCANPLLQLEKWVNEAIATEALDPTAMVLATVDQHGQADTRVVLLKEIDTIGLVFFTDYSSQKGEQMKHNPLVAANFYWRQSVRQARIKGSVEKISIDESQRYFASRSRESQICAAMSKQSSIIDSRQQLEDEIEQYRLAHAGEPIPCPERWGGYRIIPTEFEFFQGRDCRLHDRIRYNKVANQWQIVRLSP